MTTLSDLAYDEKGMLIDIITINDRTKLTVNLKKTFYGENGQTYYFINLFLNSKGVHKNIGYMYFMLDVEKRISYYVGTYIKPEYRSCGFASLLTSYYIKTVLDDDYEQLLTNKKQRKPFILYTLKRYSYDLLESDDCQESPYKIYICKKSNDLTKYLIFESERHRSSFMAGKVCKGDNYSILPTLLGDKPDDIEVLDYVIQSRIYELQDNNKGYHLALNKISGVKEAGVNIG